MARKFKKQKAAASQIPTKVFETSVPTQACRFNNDWFLGLILVLAVLLAYQPIWWAGYIWDDDNHLTANPCIVGPLGLKEIWTTQEAMICPLVFSTFWMEHALWGLAPLPYHLVNVILNGACAVVLWRVLRNLQVPGAWLGAALWALHPIQVESVAWISELKNTQSCLFYLLTILFFVRGLRAKDFEGRTGGGWNYGLTLIFAALALTSKTTTVVLPVVLGLCAWWVEGRWHWRHLMRLVPILLMSFAAIALTLWPRTDIMIDNSQKVGTWPEHLALAGYTGWFYLGKLLWPHPLIFIYPRWQIDAGHWFSYLPLLAMISVFFILWVKRDSWLRPYFFALSYFLVVLSPFLGLLDQPFWRYSFVEDHLQYLAGMGPLALIGAGLTRLANFFFDGRPWLRSAPGAVVLLTLGLLSWQRTWAYENAETLWKDTLAKNPTCWIACTNLGAIFLQEGQPDKAIVQLQKALELNAKSVPANTDLGTALLQKGQVDQAIDQFQKTLVINPHYPIAHYALGEALLQKRQVDEAIAQFQTALEINPQYAAASNDLGLALLQKGQVDQAIDQFQKTLAINPRYPNAHYVLGKVLLQKRQVDEAIAQFQNALEINPANAAASNDLGAALLQKGQVDKALEQFQRTLDINPNYPMTHYNLGIALTKAGRTDEAFLQFQMELTVDPRSAKAHYNLGTILSQKGRTDEAIQQYQQALEIMPDYNDAHFNLGVSFLQKGEGEKAMAQFSEVLKLNPGDADAKSNLAKAQAMVRQAPGSK